jgi:hypothetical protein
LHPLSSEDNVPGSKSEGEMKLSLIVEREHHGMRRRRCRVNSLPRIAGTVRKKTAPHRPSWSTSAMQSFSRSAAQRAKFHDKIAHITRIDFYRISTERFLTCFFCCGALHSSAFPGLVSLIPG